MDSGSGQYAFGIETRDSLDSSWSWIAEYGPDGQPGACRGVLHHLVAEVPEMVQYLLYEDEYDTQWRIRLWDIPVTGYDQVATVLAPGDRARQGYVHALSVDKVEPTSVITLPGHVVGKRLRAKQEARRADSRSEAGETSPS